MGNTQQTVHMSTDEDVTERSLSGIAQEPAMTCWTFDRDQCVNQPLAYEARGSGSRNLSTSQTSGRMPVFMPSIPPVDERMQLQATRFSEITI